MRGDLDNLLILIYTQVSKIMFHNQIELTTSGFHHIKSLGAPREKLKEGEETLSLPRSRSLSRHATLRVTILKTAVRETRKALELQTI